MQDNDIPMLNSVIAIAVLVGLEILMSVISMKSITVRGLLQGNSVIVIRDGKIDQKQMKRLRFTLDDLLEALRGKDVFDVSDVQYAIAETDGSLSVLLKPEKMTVTNSDMKLKVSDKGLSSVVVMDGKILKSDFRDCDISDEKLQKIISDTGERLQDIFLMTIDKNENYVLIRKEHVK